MKFTLQQFAESTVAKRNNIDNTIPDKQKKNIQEFINKLLNPLAAAYGKDILVSSGYRCPELNKLFGNDPNESSHSEGYGVDLVPADGAIDEFKDFVAGWIQNKNFDQYVDEQNSSNKWVHITYKSNDGKQRKQGLKTNNNKCGKIDLDKHSAQTASNPQYQASTNSEDPIQKNAKLSKGEAAKKERIALEYLSTHGMSIYGAAGVCGCMTYECGFNANVYNKLEYSGKGVNNTKITTRGWNCGEGLIGVTDFKYKVKIIKECQWDTRFGISTDASEYLKDSAKHIYQLPFDVQLEGLIANYKINGRLNSMASANNYKDGILGAYRCIAGGGITDWNSAVAMGEHYVRTHTKQAQAAGKDRVYYNGFLLRAETTRRILERYQSGSTNGDQPISLNSGGSGNYSGGTGNDSYNGGGSNNSQGSVDTRQYRDINVMSIRTGGSTQTGSTEGLLTGKSIYLKVEISEEEIKNNGIYTKDENGEVVKDKNGNPVPNDEYVFNEVEVETIIEDQNDLPNITVSKPDESTNEKDDGTKKISSTVNKKEANLSIDEKKKLKDERIKKSKRKWKNKFKDLNKEEVKAKLLDWLSNQPIMIQNAFHILVIKDIINKIKTFLEQLKNTSIENQMDLLNSINDILEIFELLGLKPDAEGISMDDLKKLGLAVAGTAIQTAKNIGDQVQQNAQEFTQQQINALNSEIMEYGGELQQTSENVIGTAKNAVATITDKANQISNDIINNSLSNGSFNIGSSNSSINMVSQDSIGNSATVAIETAKSTGIDIATSITNQIIDTGIDTGLNLNLDNISNGNTLLINNSESFTYIEIIEEKNINVNITILKNPSLHLLSITSYIKSYKQNNGKDIFNNGATKQIKEGFIAAWEINDTVELKLQTIVDGVTKFYTFTFNVDKAARKKEESNSENNQNNLTNNLLKGSNTNNINSLINNTENEINNISENAQETIINTTNNISEKTYDTIINSRNAALSQLTKVNIGIDASMIESVLAGKVLMFNEVVQFLKILQPIIQTLNFVAHILENYIINKEFVKTKQHVDLTKSLKNVMQKALGLMDILRLKDTNFFTIRSKEMADWAKTTFNKLPDEKGFMIIGQIDSVTDVLSISTTNNVDTVLLNSYCSTHSINPNPPLDLFKGTTLYFDNYGIKNGGYKDGTILGLDNIEYNQELNEIYYDSSNRSTISSEILRAKKHGANYNDVNYENDQFDATNPDYKSLLNEISFISDEFEGPQTLDIGNLDLCSPTVKNRDKDTLSNSLNGINIDNVQKEKSIIIEFGDEYTLGNRVEGNFTVKPGQTINEGDIIGYIFKNGKNMPIKTQYTGIVRSSNELNNGYYQIYPKFTSANRHIIIDKPVKCQMVDYNINDIIDIQNTFKKSIEIETLITNCLPLSILPSILKNANRTSLTSNSYIAYNNYINEYDNNISNVGKRMKKMGKDLQNIKNINTDEISKIKDSLFKEKEQIIKTAKEIYLNAINDSSKINGDISYLDCVGLAYNTKNDFKRYGDETLDYGNYYINLLKTIPQSTKMQMPVIDLNSNDILDKFEQLNTSYGDIGKNFSEILKSSISKGLNTLNSNVSDEPSFIDEFREIVKNIIDIRLSYESQTTDSMITYFNTYYKKYTNINNAYEHLTKYINDENISTNDQQSILKKIQSEIGDKESDFDTCKQALTLYMYIINADINGTQEKIKDVYNVEKIYKNNDINTAIINVEGNYINDNNPINYNSQTFTNFKDLYNEVYNIIKNTEYENTIQINQELIKQKTIDRLSDEDLLGISKTIIQYMVDALDGEDALDGDSLIFYKNIAKNDMYYQMVKDEATKLEQFWTKIIHEYEQNNTYNAIEKLEKYAKNLNPNATWPQSLNIEIGQEQFELFTFINPDEKDKNISDVNIPYTPSEIQENAQVVSTKQEIDLTDNRDIRDNSPITIFDYEYWLVYMLNATLFTLSPKYWADGFDTPPYMTPVLLPAIYMPIAPPVMIPVVNVLMVFGIALRGIYPAPIILMINLSSDDIDVMVFIKIALELVKDIFKKTQEYVEQTIPMMANQYLNKYLSENEIAEKAIEKFRTYSSIIKSIPIKDKALFEKSFNEALEIELNKPNKLTEANDKLLDTQKTIKETEKNTKKEINEEFDNLNETAKNYINDGIEEQDVYFNGTTQEKISYYEQKKNKDKKKYDKRQVVTREADLGNGVPPM